MILLLRLCGVLMLMLSALHLFFPRRFNWPEEFRSVSLLSRQMFYVHTGFVMLVVALNGLLYLCLAPDLVAPTRLSFALLGACALFWGTRLVVQFAVYSPELWRGKRFETSMHGAFSLLWVLFTVVPLAVLLRIA